MAYKNWNQLSPRRKWVIRKINALKGAIKMRTPRRVARLVGIRQADPSSTKQRV